MTLSRRVAAEFVGTFWLVFTGCGSAVLAASVPGAGGIGWLGVALAFGLSVATMAYALGHVSGAHFNPAVTAGLVAAGRLPARDAPGYVAGQLGGALAASSMLYLVARGRPGFTLAAGFAANGYGAHSPAGYSLGSALLAEGILTCAFVLIILGATDPRAPLRLAPLAIGLALTLVHLFDIPVTNASVNPARSTAPALFVGGWALAQLWLFWVAPVLGAFVAALLYRAVFAPEPASREPESTTPAQSENEPIAVT